MFSLSRYKHTLRSAKNNRPVGTCNDGNKAITNVTEEQASNTVEMIFVDGKVLESDEYIKDSNGYKLGQVTGQGSRTTLVELFIGDVDCVVPEFIR